MFTIHVITTSQFETLQLSSFNNVCFHSVFPYFALLILGKVGLCRGDFCTWVYTTGGFFAFSLSWVYMFMGGNVLFLESTLY